MRCNKRTGMTIAAGALVVLCLMAIARRQRGRGGRPGSSSMKWDRMRQRMEEMPEDFPPRVMFDNIERTRTATERILEILERDRGSDQPPDDRPAETTVDD